MEYYIIKANGNKVPAQGGGDLENVEVLSADKTLTVEDSGKTFYLDAIGEDLILPAVADGLNYKFICQVVTVTSDWTVTAPAAVIQGQVTVAGALIAAADESLITLVIAKFLPGDWFSLESDGTIWSLQGQVVTALGLVVTAP